MKGGALIGRSIANGVHCRCIPLLCEAEEPVGFLLGWFCRNHAAVSVEVRDTKDYFDDIPDMKLPKDMLQLAEHILETKAGDFEPEKFEDRYENAVVEMLQRKRAAMPVPTERIAALAPNVVSLMDALKRSLAAEEAKASEPAPKGKKLKKRVAGKREMLLPIVGKGTAKEATKQKPKEPARPAARQRKAS
jgi:DNA end-binding protein Ku